MIQSNLSVSSMLVVSKSLKFEMTSEMNFDSWSLLGAKISLEFWTNSSDNGMVTVVSASACAAASPMLAIVPAAGTMIVAS